MSMPTGHHAMHRPQPTQPGLAELVVPGAELVGEPLPVAAARRTPHRCRRAGRRSPARSRKPSAATAPRARRSGRWCPRPWCRSRSGRPWCSCRRSGSAVATSSQRGDSVAGGQQRAQVDWRAAPGPSGRRGGHAPRRWAAATTSARCAAPRGSSGQDRLARRAAGLGEIAGLGVSLGQLGQGQVEVDTAAAPPGRPSRDAEARRRRARCS